LIPLPLTSVAEILHFILNMLLVVLSQLFKGTVVAETLGARILVIIKILLIYLVILQIRSYAYEAWFTI